METSLPIKPEDKERFDKGCYKCGQPIVGLCRQCGQFFCEQHGSREQLMCYAHLRTTYIVCGVFVAAIAAGLAIWWFFFLQPQR